MSKGFGELVGKELPFDLDDQFERVERKPLKIGKSIVIKGYRGITVGEQMGLQDSAKLSESESIPNMVLVFLRSRNNPAWTLEDVKKLPASELMQIFNYFQVEIAQLKGDGSDSEEKKQLTGQTSIGDLEQDIPAIADSIASNSGIVL
jgi:hypothetical protein